ncbi:MAG: penicillin-binding transpeptidase domain-containing protein [Defluviitaleaceae bacterium]|nr:penicillin-binding transpeptidase domain-containing protein [Defluviitaleaceae bacterium]
MDNKKRPARRRRRPLRRRSSPEIMRAGKAVAMGILLSICVGFLMYRMWHINNAYGDAFAQFSANQRASRDIDAASEVFAPLRGGFVDRHMQPITVTDRLFTVTINAQALHDRHVTRQLTNPDVDIREEVFLAITATLGVSRFELLQMFEEDENRNLANLTGRYRRVLAHDVPAEYAIPLAEQFQEISIEETSYRWHQDPFFAPQVIGFMRGDAMWGLEAFYNEELSGRQGRNIWVDGETESVPVRDGYTLVTTLCGYIQQLAQDTVNETIIQHPALHVGMIVADPFTMEILAMAQAPTFSLAEPFNPDYFTSPQLAEIWPDLSDAERMEGVMPLWRNYHTLVTREPGSTFKPFVIAAAYEEGLIGLHSNFFCEGTRVLHNMPVRCHTWETGGCGSMNLRRALYRSCNLAMVDINEMMGRDRFYRYRGYFGFGERTGIDLPGEECVSHSSVMYPLGRLNQVEMATSSMGQGFNATTMQTITGFAALINGGYLMRPYIISQVLDHQGSPVHETHPTRTRRVISEATSDFIRNEMRFVVSNTAHNPAAGILRGTGHLAYIPGFSIGGKTGTAQQGVREERNNNLTFVAFLPVENPQYLVLLTIDYIEDEYTFAGSVVAPIVRDFFFELIRMKNIQPTGEVEISPHDLMGTPMPDFSGERLADVVRNLNNSNHGGYQVLGGGTVISHTWPVAGHFMPETSPIFFHTDPTTRLEGQMAIVPDVEGLSAEQANFLLSQLGLPAVIVRNRDPADIPDTQPRTLNPVPIPYDEPLPEAPPLPYTVYRQFPAAGSEVERGTEVQIRAR